MFTISNVVGVYYSQNDVDLCFHQLSILCSNELMIELINVNIFFNSGDKPFLYSVIVSYIHYSNNVTKLTTNASNHL